MYDNRILNKCTHTDYISTVILKLKANVWNEYQQANRMSGQLKEDVSNMHGNSVLLNCFHSKV